MSMDPVSIVALILSIIAILLWLYNFIAPKREKTPETRFIPDDPEPAKQENTTSLPDVKTQDLVRAQENQIKFMEQQARWESQFMQEAQKFSQMTRKNLEMLNTRVGIKFDVKPISEEFKKKPRGPEFVDSMDVSENENNAYDVDSSQ